MGGEKNKMQPTNLNAHTYVNVYAEFSAIVCLNSLVYTYFPCDQSAVWSGQCKVWSVECKVWSVECKVWSVKCRVWSVKWEVWSVKCGVRSEECKGWSVQWVKCGAGV